MPSSIPALTHPSTPPPTWRIALDLLDQNPHQPRSQMDEAALVELMASIREHGLLQPITVRKVGARYQVIAGHRRLEAFRRLLAEAEREDEGTAERFQTIAAHEKFDVTDEEMALFALIENMQRDDLSRWTRHWGSRVFRRHISSRRRVSRGAQVLSSTA